MDVQKLTHKPKNTLCHMTLAAFLPSVLGSTYTASAGRTKTSRVGSKITVSREITSDV